MGEFLKSRAPREVTERVAIVTVSPVYLKLSGVFDQKADRIDLAGSDGLQGMGVDNFVIYWRVCSPPASVVSRSSG